VAALPPTVTERFGEIVWAHGGSGFGWWPAFIYDPRLTTGASRQLAKKYLGKRHLVYYFECLKTPFDCLTDPKIVHWDVGLSEDYHLGKTAKASSKQRYQDFEQALHMAAMELSKPVQDRMDWNHPKLPSPPREEDIMSPTSAAKKQLAKEHSRRSASSKTAKRRLEGGGFGFLPAAKHSQVPTNRRNLTRALEGLHQHQQQHSSNNNTAQPIEANDDGALYIKILNKIGSSSSDSNDGLENVGFCKLPSRNTCTFADARRIIQAELVPDSLPATVDFKFSIPSLGPVARKQETSLGPLWALLRASTTDSATLGDGSVLRPCQVIITTSASK
jgi:hypothetical protein